MTATVTSRTRVARSWGYESRRRAGAVSSLNFYEPFVDAVMHDRLIHDFMVAGRLRTVSSTAPRPSSRQHRERGGVGTGRPRCAAAVPRVEPTCSQESDPVEQFREHVWVAPCSQRCRARVAGAHAGRAGPLRVGLAPRGGPGRSKAVPRPPRRSCSQRAAQGHARQRPRADVPLIRIGVVGPLAASSVRPMRGSIQGGRLRRTRQGRDRATIGLTGNNRAPRWSCGPSARRWFRGSLAAAAGMSVALTLILAPSPSTAGGSAPGTTPWPGPGSQTR